MLALDFGSEYAGAVIVDGPIHKLESRPFSPC
jgi:hypothetical protein